MKKVFYKIANPFRNFYRIIFRPKTFGVKILIENEGKFLMVRNSYGIGHWTFPGGGIKRGEAPENAAVREAQEEIEIKINPIFLGQYFSTRYYTRDTVYGFCAKTNNFDFKIDDGEITEAKWFSISEIPQFKSAAVGEILNLYKKLKI